MQLYMSWYIRSFFGFTFLNILYFFKYSCSNIFHRRSLYTFYLTESSTYGVQRAIGVCNFRWWDIDHSILDTIIEPVGAHIGSEILISSICRLAWNRLAFPCLLLSYNGLVPFEGTIVPCLIGCSPSGQTAPDDCGITTCNSHGITRSDEIAFPATPWI